MRFDFLDEPRSIDSHELTEVLFRALYDATKRAAIRAGLSNSAAHELANNEAGAVVRASIEDVDWRVTF